MLEEKFDVDLQFETTTYDSAAAGEKRQISLASGDYPDAYMLVPWVDQFNNDELVKLGGQGVLLPLDDLIGEDTPNIAAAFEDEPDFKELATSSDGNIWGLPHVERLLPLLVRYEAVDELRLARDPRPRAAHHARGAADGAGGVQDPGPQR